MSTHLLDRLIRENHIRTFRSEGRYASESAVISSPIASDDLLAQPPQRVCCLALCGIHLGPLRYLSSNSLLQPYFQVSVCDPLAVVLHMFLITTIQQYFESAAARELFEFQVRPIPPRLHIHHTCLSFYRARKATSRRVTSRRFAMSWATVYVRSHAV